MLLLPEGAELQGRYRILRKLGHGGFGAVYEAHDLNLERRVAIKEFMAERFHTREDELECRQNFMHEAKLLANLSHPSLPQVIDYFTDEVLHCDSETGAEEKRIGAFLVMEFIDGDDLAQCLKKQQQFEVAEVLKWAEQLLDVLDYLHSKEVIHCDIKPSNIKPTPRTIYLLDFGLAKGFSGLMTREGQMPQRKRFYSPGFASPEQVFGPEIGPLSDVYSMAATLVNLLTGEAPASAEDRVRAFDKRRPDPLRPAHKINTAVPAAVGEVLLQAMALAVDKRPASAVDMKESLAQVRQSAGAIAPPLKPKKRQVQEDMSRNEAVPPLYHEVLLKWIATDDHLRLAGEASYRSVQEVTPHPDTPFSPEPGKTDQREADSWANPIFIPVVTGMSERLRCELLESKLVLIPPGRFKMGSEDGPLNERPVHQVTITRPFYMGEHVVTQAEWKAVMGDLPEEYSTVGFSYRDDDKPMVYVSWRATKEFIKKLNALSNTYLFRLPSEAEWEYACRAKSKKDYLGEVDALAWCYENAGGCLHPVCRKQPNDFGLYDMQGNVWEWCEDLWHGNYDQAPNNGSSWFSDGDLAFRVRRGGAWNVLAKDNLAAVRTRRFWNTHDATTGFRLVAVVRE